MGIFGPPNIEKLKARGDVDGLVKALRYKDAEVVRSAAKNLAGMGEPVVDKVSTVLRDTNMIARYYAAWILGQIRSPRGIQPLLARLNDPDKNVRLAAIQSLGNIGGEQVVSGLLSAFRNPDTEIRRCAREALDKVVDGRSLSQLVPLLADPDTEVSQYAEDALCRVGPPAIDALAAAFKGESVGVCQEAVRLMAKMQDARAVGPLVDHYINGEKNTRTETALALVKIAISPKFQTTFPDPVIQIISPIIQPFIIAVQKNAKSLRWPLAISNLAKDPRANTLLEVALDSLVSSGEVAVKTLAGCLVDENPDMRWLAVIVLGMINTSGALHALVSFLDDSEEIVRAAAAETLVKAGKPAVDGLICAFKEHQVHKPYIEVLAKIGAPAVEPLIRIVIENEASLKKSAAGALGAIGSPAVGPLINLFKEKDINVRQAAVEALANVGTDAVPRLITAFDGGQVYRQASIDALVMMGEPAVPPLVDALVQEYIDSRFNSTVEALTRIGKPSIEALIVILGEFDWYKSQKAAQALMKMGWKPENDELGAAYYIGLEKWDECVAIGKPAVGPLVSVLMKWNPRYHKKAARILDELGWQPGEDGVGANYWIAKEDWESCFKLGSAAVPPLVATLDAWRENGTQDEEKRKTAARLLGRLKDPSAVEPLVNALFEHFYMKNDVLDALGLIGSPAYEPLIKLTMMDDRYLKNTYFRGRVISALGRIGDTRGMKMILDALKDESPEIRQASVEALGEFKDDSVINPLVSALNDKDRRVQKSAADALEKGGWKPDPGEAGVAYWIAKQDWAECARVGEPACKLLAAALADKAESGWAATALGMIGAPAVETIISALNTVDANTQYILVEALGEIGDPRAVEPLAALRDDQGLMPLVAAYNLVKFGDNRAVKPLVRALDGDGWGTRKKAAQTLVGLYEAGKLDLEATRLVLNQRSKIREPHEDIDHTDYTTGHDNCDQYHHDYPGVDKGIGVEF